MRHTLLHPFTTFRRDWAELTPLWRAVLVLMMMVGGVVGYMAGSIGCIYLLTALP